MINTHESKWDQIVKRLDYAFQPIVNIHTGVAYGYEVLMRKVENEGFDSIEAIFDQAEQERALSEIHQALFTKALRKLNTLSWCSQTKLFFNIDSRLFDEKYPLLRCHHQGSGALSFFMDFTSISRYFHLPAGATSFHHTSEMPPKSVSFYFPL